MSVKEINKLGQEINQIGAKCISDVNWFVNNLPKSVDVIYSKKHKVDLVYSQEYDDQRKIYEEIIKRKSRAWAEMLKLLEEFAIKEQGKKKIVKKKTKRRVKKK